MREGPRPRRFASDATGEGAGEVARDDPVVPTRIEALRELCDIASMSRASQFLAHGVAALALAFAAGCSAGSGDDFGGAGGGVSGVTKSSSAGFNGTGSFGTGAGMCTTTPECSPDGTQVLCNGQVLSTCGALESCAGGACAPACEAAKANKSSVGCEYYATNPDVTFSQGACYAAFVANTFNAPATLTVERDGQSLDVASFARIPTGSGTSLTYEPLPNGQIPPGQIAILFLAQFNPGALYTPACPAGVTTAISNQDSALHGTGIGQSFRIASDIPVVAYDIFPYGGGPSAITSATLLLPTSAWDTNYVGVQPYDQVLDQLDFYSWLQIIAAEDGTDVTIAPTSAIEGGGGLAPTSAGVPVTYSVNRGDVIQLTQLSILTGSPIQSTKPVGVVGGNRCMNITTADSACDAGHQMIPPVRALGSEYVGVPHRARFQGVPESPPWRIVGAVDGTTLSYEPAPPPGAPTTLTVGQAIEFRSGTPFVVRSQDKDHPFYMSAHMTGCSTVSSDVFGDCRGDPETVNVIPPAQFLGSYVFFTDPTYPETPLIFVRKRAQNGFADVELDCFGTLTGWQAVGADYEFTYVDLSTGNYQPVGNCNNGRHVASSPAPFGITVWGWGSGATGGSVDTLGFPYSQYVSYAYPAGASVQQISDVVVPPVPQ